MEITKDQRKIIEKEIATHDQWKASDYKLEFLAEWKNDRVPIIVAIPSKLRVNYSPRFVVMPDGQLFPHWASNVLESIFQAYFSQIDESDTEMIIELCLLFGNFQAPVGRLWTNPIEGRIPAKKAPRKDAKPSFKQDTKRTIIGFYSYDYELMYFYDCTIKIEGSKIILSAKKIEK